MIWDCIFHLLHSPSWNIAGFFKWPDLTGLNVAVDYKGQRTK